MRGDWGIQAVTLTQHERPGRNALAQGEPCSVSLSNSSRQEEVWTTRVFFKMDPVSTLAGFAEHYKNRIYSTTFPTKV